MKKIKDYLHLYLGCECQFQNGKGKMYQVDTEGCRLSGVFGNGHIGFGLCKPILRPLSDMTEEEFNEFKSISDNDFSKMVVIESVNKITRLCHKANAQAFLFSKHFDLFGLIEAGLAIDKTTLK